MWRVEIKDRNGGWNMGNGDIMEMVTQELDGKVDECEDDQIRKRVWIWWAKKSNDDEWQKKRSEIWKLSNRWWKTDIHKKKNQGWKWREIIIKVINEMWKQSIR